MLISVLGVMAIIIFLFMNYEFKQTTYHKMTHNSFLSTKLNLGRNGEYLIYRYLKRYEGSGGKFLFNCYLPRENGQTTEIDVILVCSDGIFVFESKNYSGWIFGDENSKTWTQTLSQGRGRSNKDHFLNPIMQNNLHIKYLKKIIGEGIPIHSVIVFSERCILKKVVVKSSNIFVINRYQTIAIVNRISNLQQIKISEETVTKIFEQLYPFTQVTEAIKIQHIANIQRGVLQNEVDNTNDSNQEERPCIRTSPITFNNAEVLSVFKTKPIEMASVNLKRCPICGAALVLRTAKKGNNSGKQFWGCSNYPRCKYINNISSC